MARKIQIAIALTVGISFLLLGCLERKEHILVKEDATVVIEANFSTESINELLEGDAIPSIQAGWLTEDSVEENDEGKKTFHIKAQAIFPPDVELPQNYAALDDINPDVYLQFPTTLKIEQRDDGTYYHFYRKYERRSWAHLEILKQQLLNDPLKELEGKDLKDLAKNDRTKLLKAFVDFESAKLVTFARKAFLEVMPDLPQDHWLHVHQSMNQFKNEVNYERLLALMEIPDQEERDEALEEEAEQWELAVINRLRKALKEHCYLGGSQIKTFMQRYDWHSRYYKITEDLGDDNFEITVQMPGEIVVSNANSVRGNEATWKFDGTQIRDRDQEIMVTSRLNN